MVGDGEDDGVVGASIGLADGSNAVFVLRFFDRDPGVVHIDVAVVVFQFGNDIDDAGVAQVWAVFLEGEAHDQHFGAFDLDALFGHGLDQLGNDVGAHAVVKAPAGQDDFRVVADGLGFVGEVVRVNANAVAADQAGAKGEEIPLATGRLEYRLGVDTHLVEDECELVDEGDVEVALGVFDDLGGFSDLDAVSLVGACCDDFVV